MWTSRTRGRAAVASCPARWCCTRATTWSCRAWRTLFTAGIERLRASYNFTPRAALRLVVQNEHIRRDPALEGRFMVSALLTYRWSWASAVYLGLGNDPQQQLFFKVQVARP